MRRLKQRASHEAGEGESPALRVRNLPDPARGDAITCGAAFQSAHGAVATSVVGRIADRFYPGVQKSHPGGPVEVRWSESPYSIESLAVKDAENMALLAVEEAFIQIRSTGPSLTSLNEEHKGHYVLGSRVENGAPAYYIALQTTDWGVGSPGQWAGPFGDLQKAVGRAEFSLENWVGAMDQFSDCMVSPCVEAVDL